MFNTIRAAAIAAAAGFAILAQAQTPEPWPTKPVRIVVPFPAASNSDNIARVFAEKLGTRFKQPFLVENRPGAGGVPGVAIAARAAPDGYTLLLTTSSPLVINPVMDKSVKYDPEADLAPIALLMTTPLLLVSKAGFPAKNLQELVTLVRSNPGKYSYGSNGNGSYSHMAMELFKKALDLDILHVPYRGPAQAEADLLGGQVDFQFTTVNTGSNYVKAGRLRAYGVSSREPDATAPEYPPLSAQGVTGLDGFQVIGWAGLLAPKGTPQGIVDALGGVVTELLADPAFRAAMAQKNVALVPPAQVRAMPKMIHAEKAEWAALVKSAGIRIE